MGQPQRANGVRNQHQREENSFFGCFFFNLIALQFTQILIAVFDH